MQASRHFAFATAVAIVLVVAAPGSAPVLASTPKQTVASTNVAATGTYAQREIFGFALASSLGDPTIGYPSWNFDLLSTVAFFGLHVDGAGQFASDAGWTTWNSPTLTAMVAKAHQHGTKVVLTVVLQDFSPNTPSMCAGLMHGDTTVAAAVREVKAKGVDGVNIDYEGLDGSCGTSDPYWAQHAMTAFAQKMRAGLGSSYYLSVDTYAAAASDGYGFFDVRGIAAYADSLFVMAYDLEYSNYRRPPTSCTSFCLGPTSPLTGYYYNDSAVISEYVAVAGAGKVIFGVPYYGRKACVGAAVRNALPTSSVVADSYLDASGEASDPAVQAGSYTTHRDASSSGAERWDTWYNTTLQCTRELYWDDTVSLGKKYDLVNSSGLRGVGIWNLNYGGSAPELWYALAAHFTGCSGVNIAFAPASPSNVGTAITVTGAASGCANPVYEFWLRPASSSAWQLVQGYSTSATYRWNSAGAPSGTVYFGVWARSAGSTAPADATGSAAYNVVTPCTSVSLGFTPSSPSNVGSLVRVAAGASGCANPLYKFFLRTAASGTWQVVQDYSTNSAYRWNSAGAPAGPVYFGVWVRDANSTVSVDANTSAAYVLFAPCANVSVSFTPSGSAGAGAPVTVTAGASSCASPLYEFWMRPASSSTWQLLQAYSSSSTYRWNTTGAAPGTVYFGVWARDASSGAPSDATGPASYTLIKACTSAGMSFSPASPIAHGSGTSVTVTATASGCGSPVYEFWMRPATSSTWQLVQGYSTSATYRWNTSGAPAGTVYFGIWVRDAKSTAASDTTTSAAYVLG